MEKEIELSTYGLKKGDHLTVTSDFMVGRTIVVNKMIEDEDGVKVVGPLLSVKTSQPMTMEAMINVNQFWRLKRVRE